MTQRSYDNFDLSIERSGTGYRARVLRSAAGEADEPFLPPSAPGPADPGALLFDAAFTGEVLTAYRRSLDAAERDDKGLRVRLMLADAPELAVLSWERLHDTSRGRALGLSSATPLVRYLALSEPMRPLAVTPPLAVLVVIASPKGYPTLDVEAEWAALENALAEPVALGLIQLHRLDQPTLNALQRELRRRPYHILHFLGHGGFDSNSGEGLLLLADNDGYARAVRASALATILGDHRSLRLVLLNACQGAQTGGADPYAGAAQRLVQRGIPAVVAMRKAVSDAAALAFAHEFYLALAGGDPVDAAVVEGRRALFAGGDVEEWDIPALFMRSADGRLFEVEATPESAADHVRGARGPQPGLTPDAQPSAAGTRRTRPALGGDSISHFEVCSAATLGCLVRDRADPGVIYLLCDYSGLAGPDNVMQAGDLVVQPGVYDGGDPAGDVIAVLARWGEMRTHAAAGATNISAAIATVLDRADVSPEVRGRGYLAGVRPARPGHRVYTVGRTSGQIEGRILRVGASLTLPGQVALPFADLIMTTEMLQAGDSGAVLLDADNYALGLGFVSGGGASYFIPMWRVLDALGVDLITEAVWREIAPQQ